MQDILQPLKKDKSFVNNSKTYGKLEREIQKQVSLSRVNGYNMASLNKKVKLSKYRERNNKQNRYQTIEAVRNKH